MGRGISGRRGGFRTIRCDGGDVGLTCMHVPVYALCMATKTISIDLEAYERLRRARRTPDESFSRVIKRAAWDAPPRTAAAFLDAVARTPALSPDTLDRLDAIQREDTAPEDPWRAR
jgi:hypothetical protein